ncbi:hypothetical protein LHV25_00635 [Providencia rettgeri]|uniref:hypothetical protein n=1 Tax=Providencia rettgeri TaxID=587 RepID=UPI001CFD3B6E|nr:hypothetical protein [Providencia rettgeri]MCB4853523.1 hypothetical protein [Providencia rettgeri]MCD6314090.1 hypothetical protein [Providencia rettgeri]
MYGLDNASGVNVMPKIAPVSSATPLWFTEGGAGLAASYPGQDWFNMVQAELLGVLSAGGVKPEKGKLTQLADAIKIIVNSADYQPSGDYATNTALADGLNAKVNKNNAEINGSLKIKYPGDYAKFFLEKTSGESFSIETVPDALALAATFFYKDKTGKTIASITVPKKTGSMVLDSDMPKVINTIGQSTTDVMSQKSVTDALDSKFDKTGGVIKNKSKAIDIQTTATLAGYIQISDENGNAIHQFGKLGAGAALAIKNVSANATLLLESDGIRFNNNLIALRNEIPTSATKFEDVTSSRSNNVNYVNTKKHLIFVVLQSKSSVNQNATYTVNGVLVRWAVAGSAEGFLTSATIPVPPGATYSANGFEKWIEVS